MVLVGRRGGPPRPPIVVKNGRWLRPAGAKVRRHIACDDRRMFSLRRAQGSLPLPPPLPPPHPPPSPLLPRPSPTPPPRLPPPRPAPLASPPPYARGGPPFPQPSPAASPLSPPPALFPPAPLPLLPPPRAPRARCLPPRSRRSGRRGLALDARTGTGGCSEAIARCTSASWASTAGRAARAARERIAGRGFSNVTLGERRARRRSCVSIGSGSRRRVRSRVLHHAPQRQGSRAARVAVRAGGRSRRHRLRPARGRSMREQADVWLGFGARRAQTLWRGRGLENARVTR